jgi:hypothetical protein
MKIYNVFRPAAPIKQIWAKIGWAVQKLIMVLFKLEIPIPGPNLGGFSGIWTPRKFLERLRPPKAISSRETTSFDGWIVKIGLAIFAGRSDKKRTK